MYDTNKQLTITELVNKNSSENQDCYVITIVNQKGGVGKTTTAVNLSACLDERGYRVLLIDADPQCNASLSFGFKDNTKDNTIHSLFLDNITDNNYNKYITKTSYINLDLITGNDKLYTIDLKIGGEPRREFKILEKISPIKKDYDFILFDAPPNLGLITVNLLTASNSIIVPMKADYLSLKGLTSLLKVYNDMLSYLNKDLKIDGILINMHSSSTNLSKEVEEELRKNYPQYLYDTIIPQNVRIAESPSHQLPVIYYDPRSIGSIKFNEFTDEFLTRLGRKIRKDNL
jgi:chromosome partitioning protein